jgi:hypothetical protein
MLVYIGAGGILPLFCPTICTEPHEPEPP